MKSFSIATLLLCFASSDIFASEKNVLDHIFEGYDRRIRPVKNANFPVFVEVDLTLIRLIEVNAQQEYIKLSVAITQLWKDESLVWNPADFNGTSMVYVEKSAIWLPDTLMTTTSFEPEQIIDTDRQMVSLNNTGYIYIATPFVLSNYCQMKTEEFPYDHQDCVIIISSWIYKTRELVFTPSSDHSTAHLYENSEWDIEPFNGERKDLNTTGGDPNCCIYPQVHYTITIKRHSVYYVWVVIVPTFIITALSIAGIFAPLNNIGDRQEKITLGLTTLLTLSVILSTVTDEMPRTTKLPLLGLFVLAEIFIVVICMAISAIILFLHQRVTTRSLEVPRFLSKILCDTVEEKTAKSDNVVLFPTPPPSRPLHGKDNNPNFFLTKTNGEKGKRKIEESDDNIPKEIKKTIRKVDTYIGKLEDEDKRKDQWLFLFDHVDLLLFAFFQVVHTALYVIYFHRG